MIDGEISLKSLLYVAESLEQLIGQHGAKAVLRTAGQRAAANLIEMLPLSVPENDATTRAGAILVELGFIEKFEMPSLDTVEIFGNHIYEELGNLKLQTTQSACYYVIGLFEGFFKQMSGSTKRITTIEQGNACEFWKLS